MHIKDIWISEGVSGVNPARVVVTPELPKRRRSLRISWIDGGGALTHVEVSAENIEQERFLTKVAEALDHRMYGA